MTRKNELLEAINRRVRELLPASGDFQTGIEGLDIHRRDAGFFRNFFAQPYINLIVQGHKHSRFGDTEFTFGTGEVLLMNLPMPAASHVVQASAENPFMSVSIYLKPALLAELAARLPDNDNETGLSDKTTGFTIVSADDALLEAYLRMIELKSESDWKVLGPLREQEFWYRVLTGSLGPAVRAVAMPDSVPKMVMQTIRTIRDRFSESLMLEDLAQQTHTSASTLSRKFRRATGLTPLQYQRQIRLNEARRLLVEEGLSAAESAYRVGYESRQQFARDYRSFFGMTTQQDLRSRPRLSAPHIGHAQAKNEVY